MTHLPHPFRAIAQASLRAAGLIAAAATATAAAAPETPMADELPLGFPEAYALAEDRAAVLDQLVAGTDEHDFYTCLHLQGSGRLGEVPAVLARWKERSGENSTWRRIEARQALLVASDDPATTYRFLERELGLKFNHSRRVDGAVPDRPTTLDQGLIETERFLGDILRDSSGKRFRRMSSDMLEEVLRRDLSDRQRVALLDALPRADVPGLLQVVLADFEAFPKLSFGGRKIHGKLTLAQLEALRGARAEVLSNGAYVDEVMKRLVPGSDASMDDPADELAYLERAWRFAGTLPPAFNSLKAHLLFRWIERDLEQGRVDRERFMRYLQLPRNAPHVVVRDRDRAHLANLRESFDGRSPFDPVGSDQEVVEACLQLMLRDARSGAEFYGVLEERYVKRVFAETKLLYGDPKDADQYIEMLGGVGALEALRSRVELEIARGARQHFGAADPVILDVDVKNVDDLIIKVFEIDAVAVFDRQENLNVSALDLDGLVPSSERDVSYGESALTRHRETFTFESLDRPGTYIIELVGGGVSSRAVVRKGALHLLGEVTEAGQVFRVLDENRGPVDDAILRFGGRDFLPDENGELFVPFSTTGAKRSALLRRGDLAVVTGFEHLAETYALEASVYAPGEALIAGQTATFVCRPRLTVAGERASLELLEDASLVITSTDLDGTQSTKVVPLAKIESGAILTADAAVPERVQTFDVRFTGSVRSVSQGTDVSLAAEATSFPINRIRPMSTRQTLLTRTPAGYALEVRGRTGEPVSDVEVRIDLRHRSFSDTRSARLKTDERGRIELGQLGRIASLRVSEPGEMGNTWSLDADDLHGAPRVLHGRAGGEIRVPYTGRFTASDRRGFSLLEMRGSAPLRDAFDAVTVESRYAVLRDLTPGDYRLTLKESGDVFTVRVAEGEVVLGHVVGDRRALSATPGLPLQIVNVAAVDEGLVVQLAGAGEHTRLHVSATKYLDAFEAGDMLALDALDTTRASSIQGPRSTYESGRVISDEYRYILDRREQDVFPGNMLQRPGYLLNPWVVSQTADRMAEEGRAGAAYRGRADTAVGIGGGAGGRMGGRARKQRAQGPTHNWTFDFLARPAEMLAGLVPDENGRVLIPKEALGPNHMLRLVATDDAVTACWDVTLAEQDLERRDLRLAEPLDAARPMTQSRRIAFVPAGDAFEIRDATSADAKTFDTLADVFGLYRTMAGEGSELVNFEFMTRWPDLEDAEKRTLFSEYVCHELNVFLKRRDPAFFTDVVAPYLANKGHRTFMDDWLLDADLTGYLEPWSFERLNVVERILLLQRTRGDEGQLARDLMALVASTQFSMDDVFGTVLAAGGLDEQNEELDASLLDVRERMKSKNVRRIETESRMTQSAAPSGPSSPAPMAGAVLGRELDATRGALAGLDQLKLADEIAPAEDAEAPMLGLEAVAGFTQLDKKRRESARGYFYRELESTEEYAETHYWKVRLGATNGDLVSVSPFWVDFAESDGTFVSGQFPLATRSTTEMLLALALLDLPFEAAEHQVVANGRSVRMTAGSPLLLALEDIGDAAPAAGTPDVLVGEDFFLPERRTVRVAGVERESYVTGEFLTGRPYGCRVVLTNPSSAPVQLQALLQIPEGAMPLATTQYTKGVPVQLGPYGTQSIETFFYFPGEGQFTDYPVHAGQGAVLLGAANARDFDVVRVPTTVDKATWEWVSQNGSLDELIGFLDAGNPRSLDLGQVAWRMGERASFDRVTAALERRGVMEPVLWQYGVKHQDSARTREYLGTNRAMLDRVGQSFRSELLTVDPMERATYEHLAYEPLVNGRTHVFGGRHTILNDQLRGQYGRFVERLVLQPVLSGEDRLELTYYLLLQSRIGEALETFAKIDRGEVDTKIQYDATAAYLAFYREDVAGARAIAERYTDHPVDRWRNRFNEVIVQADEIEGRGPSDLVDENDRDSSQGALAGNEPVLAVQVDGGKVIVDHERIGELEFRFHRMDIEFLFSGSPFVRGDGGAFGLVRPNQTEVVAVEGGATRTEFELPAAFRTANVMVEVRGEGIARRATYFAGDLVVQGMERYGQIRVVGGGDRAPLSKAYVKVYAMLEGGQVRFHKDGYTDLRGRFDYVSLSGVSGPPVERYAVLVMHEGAGAKIQELSPPVR